MPIWNASIILCSVLKSIFIFRTLTPNLLVQNNWNWPSQYASCQHKEFSYPNSISSNSQSISWTNSLRYDFTKNNYRKYAKKNVYLKKCPKKQPVFVAWISRIILTQPVRIKGPVRAIKVRKFKNLSMGDWDGWLNHPRPKKSWAGPIGRPGQHLLGAKIG